ncbi:hypothetical protein C922_02484 [Plasmodium inui San Antonio 1]|uniref:Uncharacterized protein n=1 Tax=Plasmodium inui San Antonio 1 TaxID=1237626 RepID=W7A580_9APIC|nr:hypothetical protein C922_02484 [Plasmodium inui San Antonio 1]EUD66900.1 hypothetical protein C922_02484 [Plasmodium inui San Antonio 1]
MSAVASSSRPRVSERRKKEERGIDPGNADRQQKAAMISRKRGTIVKYWCKEKDCPESKPEPDRSRIQLRGRCHSTEKQERVEQAVQAKESGEEGSMRQVRDRQKDTRTIRQ